MAWLATYFLWFILYSVIGWVWEVLICSVPQRKFVNRGFLNGPYCPIYGVGALLAITLLGWIESPAALFAAGAVVTCTLEYVTSWAMEKLFHARWWDYSDYKFNINGRVCLIGAIAFGALTVLMLRIIHPAVTSFMAIVPESALSLAALVLFTFFLIDAVYTVTRLADLSARLKELSGRLTASYSELIQKLSSQERRLIRAYPRWRSDRYQDALDRIRLHMRHRDDDAETKKNADLESGQESEA